MRLTEEQKHLKEKLKLEHRDRLVALGFKALTHVAAQGYSASKQTAELRAELMSLGNSEKYLGGIEISGILTRLHCCLEGLEQQHEITWQVQNIDPEIQNSFKILRDAENQLKKNLRGRTNLPLVSVNKQHGKQMA